MLPIILNNIFTRHRKEMAAAEKAREKERRSQRIAPRTNEGGAQVKPAEQKSEKP